MTKEAPKPASKATHDWVAFENQTFSLKNLESGESMHSLIGPWEEANRIYVAQSDLAKRLEADAAGPLVIYDVGMGIAANALAAIEEYRRIPAEKRRRGLRIVSFESDLSGLRLALEHREKFPFLSGWESTLEELLASRKWGGAADMVSWELHAGDFLKQDLDNLPPAGLIYFDFYSPRTCPQLWTQEIFEKVHRACHAGSVLLTYSAGTPIRASLLFAGFFVGRGVPTPAKKETTVAATRLEDLRAPLGAEWLAKLERSTKSVPLERVLRHPQFAKIM